MGEEQPGAGAADDARDRSNGVAMTHLFVGVLGVALMFFCFGFSCGSAIAHLGNERRMQKQKQPAQPMSAEQMNSGLLTEKEAPLLDPDGQDWRLVLDQRFGGHGS